jgi:hypothetical protein
MTKKTKKTLDDVAAEFIFGKPEPADTATPLSQTSSPQTGSSGLLEKLKKEPQSRVKPIRVSLDLDPEMHQRLTDLAHRLGRKKSEVLRILITQALENIE